MVPPLRGAVFLRVGFQGFRYRLVLSVCDCKKGSTTVSVVIGLTSTLKNLPFLGFLIMISLYKSSKR